MAEMFLQLQNVPGESLDDEFREWIEIKKWTWGSSAVVRWDQNQGGQSTNSKIKCLEIEKIADKASVMLHQCCLTGKHILEGHIVCRKNDGDSKLHYLKLDMTDILVSKVDWNGSGDDQIVPEMVTLEFAEFDMKYKLQKDEGTQGGENHFGFNIQRQKHK